MIKLFYNRDIPISTLEFNKYGNSNGLKSNLNTLVWGKKFSTDSIGSRPANKWTKRPKRVWIGDSVLEGLGVGDNALVTFLIQNGDTVFQHLNLAHAGNNTLDYINIVNAITDILDESYISDTKFISIVYCINDVYAKTDEQVNMKRSAPLQLIANFLRILNTYKLVRFMLFQNSDFYFKYDSSLYQDEENLLRIENHFKAIKETCVYNSIELNVFLMPYKSQFKSRDYNPQLILSKILDALSISNTIVDDRYLDVNQIDRYYLPSDEIHFSVEGHKALAEIFMKF